MEEKIGYLIPCHNDPEHVSKLIAALDYKADFYIHVDKKTDIGPFRQLIRQPNVYWVEERTRVSWAGISQVKATLSLMKQALAGGPYVKIILLSGSCYPIKSNDYIHRYFTREPDREHIRYFNMLTSNDHYRSQVLRKWFKEPFYLGVLPFLRYADKGLRVLLNKCRFRNRWDTRIVPHFGSNWIALTPACCAYIFDFLERHPGYWEMNRRTFSPDEHFFHTIVANSPFNNRADGLQAFTGRGTYKLANYHIIHPSLTKWYTESDLEEIKGSDKLFVRKLKTGVSSSLVDQINQFIA